MKYISILFLLLGLYSCSIDELFEESQVDDLDDISIVDEVGKQFFDQALIIREEQEHNKN